MAEANEKLTQDAVLKLVSGSKSPMSVAQIRAYFASKDGDGVRWRLRGLARKGKAIEIAPDIWVAGDSVLAAVPTAFRVLRAYFEWRSDMEIAGWLEAEQENFERWASFCGLPTPMSSS